jgi:hypothetical protein
MTAAAPPPGPGRGVPGPSNGSGAKKVTDTKPQAPPKYYFHSRRILDAVVIVCAVFTLLLARFFRPGFWSTLIYAAVSLPAGIVLSFIYYSRKRQKDDIRQLVRDSLCLECTSVRRRAGRCPCCPQARCLRFELLLYCVAQSVTAAWLSS